MSEPGKPDRGDALAAQAASSGCDAQIASLRAAGAASFDPVRWHYIEVLARRAQTQDGNVRRLLDARLRQALAAFAHAFAQAQQEATESVARCTAEHPHAATALQRLLGAGDFNGVRRHIAGLHARARPGALAELVRRLERNAAGEVAAPAAERAGTRPELKTVRQFRNTLSKLSVQRQVTQAIEQGPKNAGPINSHMLVLRSLALMREISPDYLNRFIAYVDTLLGLDDGESEKPAAPRKTAKARAARK